MLRNNYHHHHHHPGVLVMMMVMMNGACGCDCNDACHADPAPGLGLHHRIGDATHTVQTHRASSGKAHPCAHPGREMPVACKSLPERRRAWQAKHPQAARTKLSLGGSSTVEGETWLAEQ